MSSQLNNRLFDVSLHASQLRYLCETKRSVMFFSLPLLCSLSAYLKWTSCSAKLIESIPWNEPLYYRWWVANLTNESLQWTNPNLGPDTKKIPGEILCYAGKDQLEKLKMVTWLIWLIKFQYRVQFTLKIFYRISSWHKT